MVQRASITSNASINSDSNASITSNASSALDRGSICWEAGSESESEAGSDSDSHSEERTRQVSACVDQLILASASASAQPAEARDQELGGQGQGQRQTQGYGSTYTTSASNIDSTSIPSASASASPPVGKSKKSESDADCDTDSTGVKGDLEDNGLPQDNNDKHEQDRRQKAEQELEQAKSKKVKCCIIAITTATALVLLVGAILAAYFVCCRQAHGSAVTSQDANGKIKKKLIETESGEKSEGNVNDDFTTDSDDGDVDSDEEVDDDDEQKNKGGNEMGKGESNSSKTGEQKGNNDNDEKETKGNINNSNSKQKSGTASNSSASNDGVHNMSNSKVKKPSKPAGSKGKGKVESGKSLIPGQLEKDKSKNNEADNTKSNSNSNSTTIHTDGRITPVDKEQIKEKKEELLRKLATITDEEINSMQSKVDELEQKLSEKEHEVEQQQKRTDEDGEYQQQDPETKEEIEQMQTKIDEANQVVEQSLTENVQKQVTSKELLDTKVKALEISSGDWQLVNQSLGPQNWQDVKSANQNKKLVVCNGQVEYLFRRLREISISTQNMKNLLGYHYYDKQDSLLFYHEDNKNLPSKYRIFKDKYEYIMRLFPSLKMQSVGRTLVQDFAFNMQKKLSDGIDFTNYEKFGDYAKSRSEDLLQSFKPREIKLFCTTFVNEVYKSAKEIKLFGQKGKESSKNLYFDEKNKKSTKAAFIRKCQREVDNVLKFKPDLQMKGGIQSLSSCMVKKDLKINLVGKGSSLLTLENLTLEKQQQIFRKIKEHSPQNPKLAMQVLDIVGPEFMSLYSSQYGQLIQQLQIKLNQVKEQKNEADSSFIKAVALGTRELFDELKELNKLRPQFSKVIDFMTSESGEVETYQKDIGLQSGTGKSVRGRFRQCKDVMDRDLDLSVRFGNNVIIGAALKKVKTESIFNAAVEENSKTFIEAAEKELNLRIDLDKKVDEQKNLNVQKLHALRKEKQILEEQLNQGVGKLQSAKEKAGGIQKKLDLLEEKTDALEKQKQLA